MNVTSVRKPQLSLSRLFAIVLGLAVSLAFMNLAHSMPPSSIISRAAAGFLKVSSLACFGICVVLLVGGCTGLLQSKSISTPIVLFVALVVVESTRFAGKEIWSEVGFEVSPITEWAIFGCLSIVVAGCLVVSVGKKWLKHLNIVPIMDSHLRRLGVAVTASHIGAIVAPAMTVLKCGPPYFPT